MERKLLTPFIVAALAVAFAAVSLWVWLGRGKNARAVRTKFRLGGLLLAFTTAVATQQSCTTSCYDTAMLPACTLEDEDMQCSNGDQVSFSMSGQNYRYFSFALLDSKGNILQSGALKHGIVYYFHVSVGEYVGTAQIRIYGEMRSDEIIQKSQNMIKAFNISIAAASTSENE